MPRRLELTRSLGEGAPLLQQQKNHGKTRAPLSLIKKENQVIVTPQSLSQFSAAVAVWRSYVPIILAFITSSSRLGPSSLFAPIVVHVAPLARLRGGMEAHAEEMAVQRGKLRPLSSSEWYARCKWCRQEARLQAPNEDDDEDGNEDDCVSA